MRQADHRPIGVFDSGVGGLTVLRALRARLPNEHAVYLGDTARVPYGTKSSEVVTRYSVKNAEFLLRYDIKLLVVACNTASAFALPELQRSLQIPVIGVIDPGAAVAAQKTRSGKVGVIGTPGTIASGAYQRALDGLKPGMNVLAKACPLFVPLAEEGWLHGDVPRLVAREYLEEMVQGGVDTLVLGCTHYPLLRNVIADVMGTGTHLVDSADATAEAVVERLGREQGFCPPDQKGSVRYFVTDAVARFTAVATRFLGEPVEHAEHVDITFS